MQTKITEIANHYRSVRAGPAEGLLVLLAAALEATINAVVITDQKGAIIWVNAAFEDLTGYSPEEVGGQSTRILKSGRTPQSVYEEMWRTILAGRVWRGELINRRKDGRFYDEEMSITPVQSSDGETTHYIAIKQDITERKKAEQQLRKMGESFRIVGHMANLLQSCLTLEEASRVISSSAEKLFPDLSGAVFLFNVSHHTLEASASWGQGSALGRIFNADDCWAMRRGRLHQCDRDDTAARCAHFGADARSASLCLPLIAQGETLGIICLVAKADESSNEPAAICEPSVQLAVSMMEQAASSFANIKLGERLRAQATRDSLTGLYNRGYLDDFLEREVSIARRKGYEIGIIMLDIDRFKEFNDRFGHDAGDSVLKALGAHLMKFIRRGDLACRYGGEEFTLVLPEASLEDTRRRAEELRTSVQQLSINQGDVAIGKITLSLGVASYPDQGKTSAELLRSADAALLRAKEQGRDRVLVAQIIATSTG